MKIFIFTVLFLSSLTLAWAEEAPKVTIKKLAESFTFSDPGLYEVVSPYTGNVVYIFREQSGEIKIQAVNPISKKGN